MEIAFNHLIALILLYCVLRKMKTGYSLERDQATRNHLLFMNDFKLCGKTVKKRDRLAYSVRVFHNNIKMEFRIVKREVLVMKKEKYTRSNGMQLRK